MAKIGLSLNDYWLILRKRKWILVLSFLIIFTSSIINVNMQSPVYQAVCSIRMIERQSVSDMITKMVSYTSFDILSSLTKVLCGKPVIEKVVYELGLADENTPPEKVNDIILGIQGSVEAENVMGTNIINIIVEYGDPVMAARIANTVAKVYINIDVEEKTERAHNIRIFIEEQLAKAKKRLVTAEEKLRAFKETGEATGIAMVIQNNIAALEKEKIELKKIYTDRYPDVIKINEEIKNLNVRLQDLPQGELEYVRLTRDVETSQGSYLLLQGKLDEARLAEAERTEDIKIVNPAVIPKSPIRPKKRLAVTLGLTLGLVMGIFISFVVETLDTSMGTIDDLEALLNLPVLTVVPYIKEVVSKKENWFERLLQTLRIIKKGRRYDPDSIGEMRRLLLIKHPQKSNTTEAFRILRTNIKAEELIKNDKHILLITSTVPKEGKSIIALNFALSLAQDGYRTLLVDCDLRKALLHKIFSMDKEPGLSNILLGNSTPDAAIRNLVDIMMTDTGIGEAFKTPGLDNFHLLTCGKMVTNPAELLDSTEVRQLFSDLKKRYDFIVLDCPPVLPVPDAIILGTKVSEKVYLVYRSGYTSKIAIFQAKKQLDMMKVVPSGIILNSATPESELVSDYYYHYYHYRYYSEPEKKEEA